MSPSQRRRLGWLLFLLAGTGLAAALVLNAFRSNMLFFFTPTQVVAGEASTGRAVRVGGLVAGGSVRRATDRLNVTFDITDTVSTVPVSYEGVLPDLFREGQGVVVKGRIGGDGRMVATEVLAKHDENYMPPEVADALKAAGTMGQGHGGDP